MVFSHISLATRRRGLVANENGFPHENALSCHNDLVASLRAARLEQVPVDREKLSFRQIGHHAWRH